jgi:hypothetical protein
MVKAVVIACVTDNLGAHALGGFAENCSTDKHFCKFCQVSHADFVADPLAVGPWRTPASYKADLQTVVDSEGRIAYCNGVKCASPMNKLTHYSVATPGLPPCLAHDFLEGIVDYDLALPAIFAFIQSLLY